ncbi:MAG: phytoene desaturase [Bacteroidetes bacterium]|jgi:phytoene desaturase|nr:phytoene desaturase [Bacteroidota bacterium]
MSNKVAIIGSGFSGLSAACSLAHKGFDVNVYEKNELPGGRARKLEENGYVFDMGPTWYWLPDVFENFFGAFGKTPSDYYKLVRLDPSYRMFFQNKEYLDMPADYESILQLFESIEPGSAKKLDKFLKEAAYKYQLGINNIVHKPALKATDFMQWDILKGAFKLDVFRSISSVIRRQFKDERLIRILEFPVIFLGAKPADTPALYSLMNYADMSLGTWYPMGGMYKVIEGMKQLAGELGTTFHFNAPVSGINIRNNLVTDIQLNGKSYATDYVLGSADYHYIDQQLTPLPYRNYSEKYWEKRSMAPSALLFYLGINKKLPNLLHHNLVFDTSFEKHADEIYKQPKWPEEPAIYISCSTKTDAQVAPEGHENVIVLIPVAPGLSDSENITEHYYHYILQKLEYLTGENIKDHVVYKKSYAHSDFITDYNAYKGNAYGLANTLKQTGFMKPKIKNRKVKNLFYAGQLTTPGPGVPPSIISGMVSARELEKQFNMN